MDAYNKPTTVNNRIAAIKSFMHYVLETEPEYGAIAKRALMLPVQKYEAPLIEFITKNEFKAMLDTCDTTNFIGARDKLMLLLLYNTGIRVSELLNIKITDIHKSDSTTHASLKVYGKGRKEREIPLWRNTIVYLNSFLEHNSGSCKNYLFINKNGHRLTRLGIRTRLKFITSKAKVTAPSLLSKNVTAHTFRHSVAMNLLHSGIDISTIAIWLGHESIETTHKYMVADMEVKRKALKKSAVLTDENYKYTPSDKLLKFLDSL